MVTMVEVLRCQKHVCSFAVYMHLRTNRSTIENTVLCTSPYIGLQFNHEAWQLDAKSRRQPQSYRGLVLSGLLQAAIAFKRFASVEKQSPRRIVNTQLTQFSVKCM